MMNQQVWKCVRGTHANFAPMQSMGSGLSMNRLSLTSMCLLISFTLGGISSQIGLLVSPIAEAFDLTQTVAAAQFSWLTGGILAGNILAAPTLRFFNIRYVVACCYGVLIACSIGLHSISVFHFVPFFFSIIGLSAGIGVCAASTIIAQIWQANHRQSVLVAQDAFFNSGGMAFPAAIGFLLARHFAWSWGYLNIALIGVVIVFLASVSRFDLAQQSQPGESSSSDWPLGLLVAGACLFAIIVCFVTITIWLPTHMTNTFGASPDEAAVVISKIFLSALVGSLLFTIIVMKVSIQRFIAVVVLMGSVSTFLFVKVSSINTLTIVAYAYGLAIAAVYHSFIAWGLSYTKQPNYKHVTFLYVCPGIGGTIAPFASSKVVETFSISTAFLGCSFLYGAVLVAVVTLGAYDANRNPLSG
jgi:TsgA-like MFS transporter